MLLIFDKFENPETTGELDTVVIGGVMAFGQYEVQHDAKTRDWVWLLTLKDFSAFEEARRLTGWDHWTKTPFTLVFEPDTQDVAWFIRLNCEGLKLETGNWRLFDDKV